MKSSIVREKTFIFLHSENENVCKHVYMYTHVYKVLRSIGYKTLPVDSGVPYDEKKGTIPNKQGRVLNGNQGLQN